MPTAKKASPMHLWWVRHPKCGLAIVNAPNWEQAAVEATVCRRKRSKLIETKTAFFLTTTVRRLIPA